MQRGIGLRLQRLGDGFWQHLEQLLQRVLCLPPQWRGRARRYQEPLLRRSGGMPIQRPARNRQHLERICNGDSACHSNQASVGDYSCNGVQPCSSNHGAVGTCQHNFVSVPACADADADGVRDQFDSCPGTDFAAVVDANGCPPDPVFEGGGTPPPDTDGDGMYDGPDNCDFDANPGQVDTDADGQGDACDGDDDNDGVADAQDNCDVDPNPEQVDTDTDGAGDVCDLDDDNDRISDAADNCDRSPNIFQDDDDADGVGDVCDPDDDNDGVLDESDACPNTPQREAVDANGCAAPQLDGIAPTINCSVPDQAVWYGGDVSIPCTADDGGSGLASASDASFSLSTSIASGMETNAATTGSRQVCDNAGNCVTAGPYTFKVDRKAPQLLSCDAPDGLWHAANVTLHCTYTDGGSGPSSQAIALSTNVAAGTETNNAVSSPGSDRACDAVFNCAAPPTDISGNLIDRKGPTISCSPAAFVLNQSPATVTGVATDAAVGPPSQNVSASANTSSIGSMAVSLVASDNAGNMTAQNCPYTVKVTPPSLCLLTKQFIQSSPKYLALPLTSAQRAAVDALANAACQKVAAIVPSLTPAQEASLVKLYKLAVGALVPGWLTPAQAALLKSLADAL